MTFLKDMPNPTPAQLASPEFEAIWSMIKDWDINAPEFYEGYCGANGSHVVLILKALDTATEELARRFIRLVTVAEYEWRAEDRDWEIARSMAAARGWPDPGQPEQ